MHEKQTSSLMWYRPPWCIRLDHSVVQSNTKSGSPSWFTAFILVSTCTKSARFTSNCSCLVGFLYLFSRLTATTPDIYLAALLSIAVSGPSPLVYPWCFASSQLLCVAVSSKVCQILAAVQVKTHVGSTLRCGWTQTPPPHASFISGLPRCWWKVDHTEACKADGCLYFFPELMQWLAWEMSRMAISVMLFTSILSSSSSSKPTRFPLGEHTIALCLQQGHTGKKTICISHTT